MKQSAFLVVFQATIGGQLVQSDIPTIKNPMNSRQVRRDCEVMARAAFVELAAKVGLEFKITDKIKCVECVEFMKPDEDE